MSSLSSCASISAKDTTEQIDVGYERVDEEHREAYRRDSTQEFPEATTNGVPISIRVISGQHGIVNVERFVSEWGEQATIVIQTLEGDGSAAADWASSRSAAGVQGGRWRIKRTDRYPQSFDYEIHVNEARRGNRTHVVLVVEVDDREQTRRRVRVVGG